MTDEERARREQYRYRLVESFFQLHQTGDSRDPSFDNIAATIGLPQVRWRPISTARMIGISQ